MIINDIDIIVAIGKILAFVNYAVESDKIKL